MIILDEKMTLPPPPPYVPSGPVSPPPFPSSSSRIPPSLPTVPPHILLKIVYETFTHTASIERQRKTLYWLNTNLRFVSRAIYVACMHILRSTYLPAYASHIRPPYTSDPFPLTSPTSSISPLEPSLSSPIALSLQRETKVLDLFIALKVREDVWIDDSELHLERDESFRDLFDLMQPRSRMEDLIRGYGVREGIVGVEGVGVERSVKRQVQSSSTSDVLVKIGNPPPPGSSARKKALAVLQRTSTPSSSSPSSTPPPLSNTYTSGSSNRTKTTTTTYPIPFSALNVNFSSRKVGLVLSTRERKRTIVEVERTKEERLEAGAKRLVRELKVWMTGQGQGAW